MSACRFRPADPVLPPHPFPVCLISFMVGQYGFVNPDDFYAGFLEGLVRAGTSGSLIWSFRSHSNNTGFKVHREDANNAGYHLPGWPNPTTSAT